MSASVACVVRLPVLSCVTKGRAETHRYRRRRTALRGLHQATHPALDRQVETTLCPAAEQPEPPADKQARDGRTPSPRPPAHGRPWEFRADDRVPGVNERGDTCGGRLPCTAPRKLNPLERRIRLIGEIVPASQAEGSQAEGSQAEGSQAEGSQAEGSQAEGSQAELRSAVVRDQVSVFMVLNHPAVHERAVGKDRQVPLPDRVQSRPDKVTADALTAETVAGFGVGEGDLVSAQVILDDASEFTVRADLESLLVRIVGNLQVHGPQVIRPYPGKPR